jgi:chaperonin GroEL
MGVQYQKVKSVGKVVVPPGAALEKKILSVMKLASDVVGATLGPGGRPVLLESPEFGLPNKVTKDGVTVFRSLGILDPVEHCIMESARDASVRTATEAGDGTTTATVLSEAIVRRTYEFCKKNPRVSPQRVVMRLKKAFKEDIEPAIRQWAEHPDFETPEGKEALFNVARISANGEAELAQAVMDCYELIGDEGNVTLAEEAGPSSYKISQADGYFLETGYEESCGPLAPKFINDVASQRVYLEKPIFVLYYGKINQTGTIQLLMERIGEMWQKEGFNNNVVIVATGFSERVIADLALNFGEATTINVVPLIVGREMFANSDKEALDDLAAVTGAKVFDPSIPLESALPEDLGKGIDAIEIYRGKTNIVGNSDSLNIEDRVEKLKVRKTQCQSLLEEQWYSVRIGKLSGGLARLTIVGSSNGELRERKDRAEDAIMAVRGAIKHGALPGGGWTLLRLCDELATYDDQILDEVLVPALKEPVFKLLENAGFNHDEATGVIAKLSLHDELVYDAMTQEYLPADAGSLLDSVPAVLEAVRNSISIASLLGTLGGAVVYFRDFDLERSEARDTADFIRNANINEADERG